MKVLTLFWLLSFSWAAPAWGVDYMPHVAEACARWNVPTKLVLAIIQQESGGNPWAVNVEGHSYFPESRAAALRLADSARLAGKSYDLGLMQINSFWLRRFKLPPDFVIEPRNNIIIGAWILAAEIRRYGFGWQAVASYHTPVAKNPERARRYALAIISHLKRMP
jgi:soluble lytic murein transglycosylase-like protein